MRPNFDQHRRFMADTIKFNTSAARKSDPFGSQLDTNLLGKCLQRNSLGLALHVRIASWDRNQRFLRDRQGRKLECVDG
jgi:hypothetical protein